MTASVCLAQVDDARGDTRSALKYWAKAAKLGHPEAQFRLGRVRVSACCRLLLVCTDQLTNCLLGMHTKFDCTPQAVALELPYSGSLPLCSQWQLTPRQMLIVAPGCF